MSIAPSIEPLMTLHDAADSVGLTADGSIVTVASSAVRPCGACRCRPAMRDSRQIASLSIRDFPTWPLANVQAANAVFRHHMECRFALFARACPSGNPFNHTSRAAHLPVPSPPRLLPPRCLLRTRER